MISVDEAKTRIVETVSTRPTQRVSLERALGKSISENITSPIDLPLFNNSAMDGYAVVLGKTRYVVVGTIQAGEHSTRRLNEGEAVRIFTGAMIVEGADTVIKQEDVVIRDEKVCVVQALKRGDNIRCQGEEIKKGDLLFQRGEIVTPAGVGLLASAGVREVPVCSLPRVGIVITGSEIVTDIKSPGPGKIFDSNSYALRAALEELRLTSSFVQRVPDDQGSLERAVSLGLSQSDVMIVTGGVSVGDFDFVRDVAERIGVEEIFWKVKQKPGKPLFFGKLGDKILFGLPGNPVSALVCFYEYVRPSLLRSIGANNIFLMSLRASLKEPLRKKAGLTHFVRGIVHPPLTPTPSRGGGGGQRVEILDNQGSHMMTSFARSNCLVVLPEEQEDFQKGEEVEIHLLPL